MPLYEYGCASGHRREELRKYDYRDAMTLCSCGLAMTRLDPLPSRRPDGIYSYAPNIGRSYDDRQKAIADTGRP